MFKLVRDDVPVVDAFGQGSCSESIALFEIPQRLLGAARFGDFGVSRRSVGFGHAGHQHILPLSADKLDAFGGRPPPTQG